MNNVTCPHCGEVSDIGSLTGPTTDNCPRCGKPALYPSSVRAWQLQYEEMGGYDCITPAFIITDGNRTIAEIDLRHYRTVGAGYRAPEITERLRREAYTYAALIAAAPDMKAALENAVRCGERDGMPGNPGSAPAWVSKARAALAKATATE